MSSISRPGLGARLKGVRNPPPIHRRSTPSTAKPVCRNPNCYDAKIETHDDKRICVSCGMVVNESNIVSEVTFGESAAGAAILQGSYVGADQSHAKSAPGGMFKRAEGSNSRDVRNSNGKRYINQLAATLHISPAVADTGHQVFKLAVGHNFTQGRRVKHVAAIALYIGCRKQKRNSVMLIDLADVLDVNVFKLGRAYKDFLKVCAIKGIEPQVPENLVYRFATKLEFGSMTERVAQDAARLVQRMDRDWLTTGRRPAGICGACLILAARMNNFRRTIREVVYVVKVADLTISKRLQEFRGTDSSGLTVEEFRIIDLEKIHDPPAFTAAQNPKKRKRMRQGADEDEPEPEPEPEPEQLEDEEEEEEEEEEGAGDASDGAGIPTPTTTQASASTRPQREVRRDQDGFAIPEIPIDPTLLAVSATALSELTATPRTTQSNTEASAAEKENSRPSKRTRRFLSQSASDDQIDELIATPPPTAANTQPSPDASPSRKRNRADHEDDGCDDDVMSVISRAESVVSTTNTNKDGSRPRKRVRRPLPQPTAEDLAEEAALEDEISQFLHDPSTQEHAEAYAAAQAAAAKAAAEARERDLAAGRAKAKEISMEQEIGDDEFADDPEVADCLLTPAEIEIKERIWVHENKDYLRLQQQRMLRRQLDEENGGPPSASRRANGTGTKKRKGRIGEGNGGKRAKSAAEAAKEMLKRRGFSNKINYDIFDRMFDRKNKSKNSGASSETASRANGVGANGDGNGRTDEDAAQARVTGGENDGLSNAGNGDDDESNVDDVGGSIARTGRQNTDRGENGAKQSNQSNEEIVGEIIDEEEEEVEGIVDEGEGGADEEYYDEEQEEEELMDDAIDYTIDECVHDVYDDGYEDDDGY